ncbi:uncharacterized protein LOC110604887 [Manihot esculenta]|uniref:uncharacterized protein LOC110604887 n=1 Tax=Manihot esculenta TaxID=3983 RepID=UPI000B5D11A5|nr:uncharacterized protein LOC110604887 [Manihot esculenta]
MAIHLQNTAHWLGQMMQQRSPSTPVNVLPVVEEPRTNEPQPTLNHPQTNNREIGERGRRARGEEEPEARVHGRRVRELIENDEVDSYSARTTRRTESKAWREEYRLEKRPRQEEENETIPKKFMMPPMVAYEGTGNPREHVLNYKTFMEQQTLSNALMCKVFPTTLIGPARTWFNSLEAGSIRSFGDLATIFISRFIAGVPVDRKTSYLETVRQRRNETLREYVARFNTEALQIPELDENRAVEAMQKGTTSPEFFGSLSRKPPTLLAELMKRAEKYIMQDDALVTSRFAKEAVDRGKALEEGRPERQEKKQGKRPEAYRQPWDRRDQGPFPPRIPEQRALPPQVPENLTPLNASRVEVLMAVQNKEFLQWSKPMRAELISEIERLIKRGHLRNFVKKPEGERPQQNPATERPRRTRAGPVNDGSSGTINMIVGGTGGRMSRRGRKRGRDGEGSNAEVMQIDDHSPMTISFSPEDAQGVQMPHDDALVVEAVTHNYRVRKILVDNGSKVNLLPYRVFQQMRIPEEQLVRD